MQRTNVGDINYPQLLMMTVLLASPVQAHKRHTSWCMTSQVKRTYGILFPVLVCVCVDFRNLDHVSVHNLLKPSPHTQEAAHDYNTRQWKRYWVNKSPCKTPAAPG